MLVAIATSRDRALAPTLPVHGKALLCLRTDNELRADQSMLAKSPYDARDAQTIRVRPRPARSRAGSVGSPRPYRFAESSAAQQPSGNCIAEKWLGENTSVQVPIPQLRWQKYRTVVPSGQKKSAGWNRRLSSNAASRRNRSGRTACVSGSVRSCPVRRTSPALTLHAASSR